MTRPDEEPISKKSYASRVAALRAALVRAQVELKAARIPVLLVVAGEEASGKGDVVNNLNAWLDPRGVETHSFREPTDEERDRPPMWRYWRCLPERGRIAIYAGSWYSEALREAPRGPLAGEPFEENLKRIVQFERLLTADGALIVKCWLRLSKGEQGRRLHDLQDDPLTAWRVSPSDWTSHRDYDRLAELSARMRRATGKPAAPWHVIDASDQRARDLAVGDHVLSRFRAHLRSRRRTPAANKRARVVPLRPAGVQKLHSLPLDQDLSQEVYETKIEKWLGRLNAAVRAASAQKRSLVFVFEGWDAAGKGGAIRRLTDAIDARDCRVIPVARPTEEEAAHHYLWRFWRHVPPAGRVTIYDRSWYGRVLVERLEGFAGETEWRRAFAEINAFEEQLTGNGAIVLKYWMHISKAEQLKRFRNREDTPYKRHKMNAEDWRNRRKWGGYEVAVGDMLALTGKPRAPWQLIAANNKRHARLLIVKTACQQIIAALDA